MLAVGFPAFRRRPALAVLASAALVLLGGGGGTATAGDATAAARANAPSFARLAMSPAARRLPAVGMASSTRLPVPPGSGPDVRRVRYRYGPIDVTPGQNWINLGAITPEQKPGRAGFVTRIRPTWSARTAASRRRTR